MRNRALANNRWLIAFVSFLIAFSLIFSAAPAALSFAVEGEAEAGASASGQQLSGDGEAAGDSALDANNESQEGAEQEPPAQTQPEAPAYAPARVPAQSSNAADCDGITKTFVELQAFEVIPNPSSPNVTTAKPNGSFTPYLHISPSLIGGSAVLDYAWIEIELPGDVIRFATFNKPTISGQTSLSAGQFIPGNSAKPAVLRIQVKDLASALDGSYPFTIYPYTGIVPQNYEIKPTARLYYANNDADHSMSSCPVVRQDGTDIAPADQKAAYKVVYDTRVIAKRANAPTTSSDQASVTQIGINSIYYGKDADNDGYVDAATAPDVTYYFGDYPTKRGDSTLNYRLVKDLTITDTLPTYKNKAGQTVTATFEAAKNPGWTLSADGKSVSYSYTNPKLQDTTPAAIDEFVNGFSQVAAASSAYATVPNRGEYDSYAKAFQDLKLVLSFPGIKADKAGTTASAVKVTNKVTATGTPWNVVVNGEDTDTSTVQDFAAQEPNTSSSATNTLGLIQTVYTAGMVGKTDSLNPHTLMLENGYVHTLGDIWNTTFTNPNAQTKNLVIEDSYATGIPESMYVRSMSVEGIKGTTLKNFLGSDGYYEILKSDGTSEKYDWARLKAMNGLADATTSTGTIKVNDTIYEALQRDGAQAAGFSQDQVEVVGVRLVQGSNVTIDPGFSVNFYVYTMFRDPNNLQSEITANPQKASLKNTSSVKANLVAIDSEGNPATTATPLAAYPNHPLTLTKFKESIGFAKLKQTGGQNIGDVQKYRFGASFQKMARGFRYTNMQYVDLVPVGLDPYIGVSTTVNGVSYPIGKWDSSMPAAALVNSTVRSRLTYLDWDAMQVVPNYQGTGRTGIVIPFAATNPATGKPWTAAEITARNKEVGYTGNSATGWIELYFQTNLYAANGVNVPENTNYAYLDGTDSLGGSLSGANGYFAKNGVSFFASAISGGSALQSTDKFDIGGEPGSGDKMLGGAAPMTVTAPYQVTPRKWIRSGDHVGTSSITTNYAEPFSYYLEAWNNSTTAISKIAIYDELPQAGDTNYDLAGSAAGANDRGSGFTNYLTGPVTCVTDNTTDTPCDAGKYTIKYSTATGTDDVSDAVTGSGWLDASQVTDWSKIRSIYAVMNPGYSIDKGASDFLKVPVKAPLFSKSAKYSSPTATNTFAVSFDDGSNWKLSNAVSNQLALSFNVKKDWQGGYQADGATLQLMSKIVGSSAAPAPFTYDHDDDPATDEVTSAVTLSEANDWNQWFYNLPAHTADGKAYEYSLSEMSVDYYRHDDAGNVLYQAADGSTGGVTDKTQAAVDNNGDPIALVERSIPVADANYEEPKVDGSQSAGFTVKNQYDSPTVPLSVDVEWKDGANATKPEVTLSLQRQEIDPDSGEVTWVAVTDADGKPVTVTVSNGATDKVSFGDQPIFTDQGEPITYRVAQTGLSGTNWSETSITEITPARTSLGADGAAGGGDDTVLSPKSFAYQAQDDIEDLKASITDTNVHVTNGYDVVKTTVSVSTEWRGTEGAAFAGENALKPATWVALQVWNEAVDSWDAVVLDGAAAIVKTTDGSANFANVPVSDVDGNLLKYRVIQANDAANSASWSAGSATLGTTGNPMSGSSWNNLQIEEITPGEKNAAGVISAKSGDDVDIHIVNQLQPYSGNLTVTTRWLEGSGSAFSGDDSDVPTTTVTLTYKNADGEFVPVLKDGQLVTATVDKATGKADFGTQPFTTEDGVPIVYGVSQTGLDGTNWVNTEATTVTPAEIKDGVITETGDTELEITNTYQVQYSSLTATTAWQDANSNAYAGDVAKPGTKVKLVVVTRDADGNITETTPAVDKDGTEFAAVDAPADGSPVLFENVPLSTSSGKLIEYAVAQTTAAGASWDTGADLAGTDWSNISITPVTPGVKDAATGKISEKDAAQRNVPVVNQLKVNTGAVTTTTEWRDAAGEAFTGDDELMPKVAQTLQLKGADGTFSAVTDKDGKPVQVSVTKGKASSSPVEFQVQTGKDAAGGAVYTTVSATWDANGKVTFAGVPLTTPDGKLATYSVAQSVGGTDWVKEGTSGNWCNNSISEVTPGELAGDGLSVVAKTEANIAIENQYQAPTTTLKVQTTWKDGENIAKPGTTVTLKVKDPDTYIWVTVTDENGDPVTAEVAEDGTASFPDVPLTDENGNLLSYTVTQTGLDGSDWAEESIIEVTPGEVKDGKVQPKSEADRTVPVVNRYETQRTSVTVQTTWLGPDGHSQVGDDTPKPGTKVALVTEAGQPVKDASGKAMVAEVSADGKVTFDNVPVTDEHGQPVTYRVLQSKILDDEGNVAQWAEGTDLADTDWKNNSISRVTLGELKDGKVSIKPEQDRKISVVNQLKQVLGEVTVSTEWQGAEGAPFAGDAELKPAETWVKLYTVDAAGVLTHAVDKDGNEIAAVKTGRNYDATFADVPLIGADGSLLQYTVKQLNDAANSAAWATGTNAGGVETPGDMTGSTFANKAISVVTPGVKDATTGKVSASTDASQSNIKITNKLSVPTASVEVNTTWIGGAEGNIAKPGTTVTLKVKNTDGDFVPAKDKDGNEITATVDADGKASFTDVPLSDENGRPLTYTVTQTGLDDSDWAEKSITDVTPGEVKDGQIQPKSDKDRKIAVVNEYQPPAADITVSTEWKNGEQLAKPGTTVTLLVKNADGEFVPAKDKDGKEITVTVGKDGKATFPDVPLTDSQGNPLTYTVAQTGLDGTHWANESIEEITPGVFDVETGRVSATGDTDVHLVNKYVVPSNALTVSTKWLNAAGEDYPAGGPIAKPQTTVVLRVWNKVGQSWDTALDKDGNPVPAAQTQNGAASFADLPVTDKQGNVLKYTVIQVSDDTNSAGWATGEAMTGTDWGNVSIETVTLGELSDTGELTVKNAADDVDVQVVNKLQVATATIFTTTTWEDGEDTLKPDTTVTLQVLGADGKFSPLTDKDGNALSVPTEPETSVTFTMTDGSEITVTVDENGAVSWENVPVTDVNGTPLTFTVSQTGLDGTDWSLKQITPVTPAENVDGKVSVKEEAERTVPVVNGYQVQAVTLTSTTTWQGADGTVFAGDSDLKPETQVQLMVWDKTAGKWATARDNNGSEFAAATVGAEPVSFAEVPLTDTKGNLLKYRVVQTSGGQTWGSGEELTGTDWANVTITEITPGVKDETTGKVSATSDADGLNIPVVNRYQVRTTDITVTTKWTDGEDVLKPGTEVTLKVKRGGVWQDVLDENGEPRKATVGEDGSVTFADVPLTDEHGGLLTYTVTQTGLDDTDWGNESITEITPGERDESGKVIEKSETERMVKVTNEYQVQTTNISVRTDWRNALGEPFAGKENRKVAAQVKLMVWVPEPTLFNPDAGHWAPAKYADGAEMPSAAKSPDGVVTFAGVPLTDSRGNLLKYAVEQLSDAYNTQDWATGDAMTGSDWANSAVSEITPGVADESTGKVTLSAEAEATQIVITNNYQVQTVDLTVNTTWRDNSGTNQPKPGTKVTLRVKDPATGLWTDLLDEDGKPVTAEIGRDGKATFTDVPVTDADGNLLTFSVTQTGLDGTAWEEDIVTEITPGVVDEITGKVSIDEGALIIEVVNEVNPAKIPPAAKPGLDTLQSTGSQSMIAVLCAMLLLLAGIAASRGARSRN